MWLSVGTIVTNGSKDRNEDSVPFREFSNGALKKIKKGWMRKATLPGITKKEKEIMSNALYGKMRSR